MRRTAVALAVASLTLAGSGPALAHDLDHPPPTLNPTAPLSSNVNSGGEGATWELITTVATGNPHTDLDFFTRGGTTYVAVGTLAISGNAGGQTIVKLTDDAGEVSADTVEVVGTHPSATCLSDPNAALGLQHDVEATPKGQTLLNTENPFAITADTQLIVDATDAGGRCHDQGNAGLEGAPQGGLEIIDVTDPADPVEIGLTSHIGEAHTVNIDPKRPHIAYAVTSDGVGTRVVDDNDTPDDPTDDTLGRVNEDADGSPMNLDGFEVVDLSSCMNFPSGTSIDDKRAQCQPEVYRYRYPDIEMVLGHTNTGTVYGCHELEVYPDDTLTCASGQALLVLDLSGAFDDNGTPTDHTDDVPRGTPLPCSVRESSSADPLGIGLKTGAPVTDCVTGEDGADLTVPGWIDLGSPSLEGVEWVGTAYHMGRESATGAADPAFPSSEDIDFNHEAELTHSGEFVFASDERGGGVLPPGASCSPEVDNPAGNGGLHAYRMDALRTEHTFDPEEAFESYARTPEGEKAIIRVPIRTEPQAALCTAHVFHQIPGQNRIFMGWYSQGTHVIDYVEHPDGSFEWQEVAWFIPEHANQWVSAIFDFEENEDGSFTYYGVAGDFFLADGGRSAIDVYRVTLPPPAQFADGTLSAPSDGGDGSAAPDDSSAAPDSDDEIAATGGGAAGLGGVMLLAGMVLAGVGTLRRTRDPASPN